VVEAQLPETEQEQELWFQPGVELPGRVLPEPLLLGLF
jgi:hypothetical protein